MRQVPQPYAEALKVRAELERERAAASDALGAVAGGGPLGVTPDSVKATPAYREARARYDAAHAALRDFNGVFVRRFKAEERARRLSPAA